MISEKLQKKLIKQAKSIPNLNRYKHYSFIIKKNKIISCGINQWKSHPLSKKFGYEYIHSELAAVIAMGRLDINNKKIVNIMLNRRGQIMMSRPCQACRKFLFSIDLTQIYYSTQGGFCQLC